MKRSNSPRNHFTLFIYLDISYIYLFSSIDFHFMEYIIRGYYTTYLPSQMVFN